MSEKKSKSEGNLIEGKKRYNDLYVETIYDGKDLIQVQEIFHYDENGERINIKALTDLCIGIDTCADHGHKGTETLKLLIESNLKAYEITFDTLTVDEWE
ncbi:hypothetical protein [Thalassotalea crassostreae]|uniref:hypothetical protein n=1 Tax=Thalassotalea crassostreae TaxID=1763536 RepID=UPI0008382A88|nr:hypothetical protein [Thalassotalea crassostreae]